MTGGFLSAQVICLTDTLQTDKDKAVGQNESLPTKKNKRTLILSWHLNDFCEDVKLNYVNFGKQQSVFH